MVPRPAGVTGDLVQALVEFSSDAITLLDERGVIHFASRSTERLLGYTPEERQDTSVLDLIHADDLPGAHEALSRVLAEPGVPITRELLVRHKDGSWRHIEAVAVNRLAEPAVGAIVVNYRDVTGQKRAEEALRASDTQLRQSQRMEAVGRLARDIGHDFNNVLAAILGCAELMQLRLSPDSELMIDLREISKAAERGAALTKQLLDFSRRHTAEAELIDVHAVLRGFESTLQRTVGDIALRIHTPGPPPVTRAAPGQIEQVLMNLVINARDASPAGGAIDVFGDIVTVDADAVPALAPGRYARVAVRDTGAGIDPDLRQMVFEPFFTTRDPSRGDGLGLSIVHGIAKEARGAVTFSDAPGQGTTFEVFLPLVESRG